MPVGTVAARERLAFNPADWTLPSPGSPCESLQPSCDAAIACQPACAAKGRAVPLGFQAAPASLGAAIGESSSPAVSAASTASAEVEARSPAARRRRPFRSDSWEPEVAFPEQSEQQEEHQVFNGPQDRYAGTALSPSCSTAAADSAPFAAAAADSFATPPAGLLPSPGCTAWSGRSAGSDAATPASRLSASPHQQQVEILEARLAAERDARAALTRRLAEQRAEAEQQCQALGQRYEQQLAELRDELQQGAAAAAATAASGGNLAGGCWVWDGRACRGAAEGGDTCCRVASWPVTTTLTGAARAERQASTGMQGGGSRTCGVGGGVSGRREPLRCNHTPSAHATTIAACRLPGGR